jgi:hypothetical protein
VQRRRSRKSEGGDRPGRGDAQHDAAAAHQHEQAERVQHGFGQDGAHQMVDAARSALRQAEREAEQRQRDEQREHQRGERHRRVSAGEPERR